MVFDSVVVHVNKNKQVITDTISIVGSVNNKKECIQYVPVHLRDTFRTQFCFHLYVWWILGFPCKSSVSVTKLASVCVTTFDEHAVHVCKMLWYICAECCGTSVQYNAVHACGTFMQDVAVHVKCWQIKYYNKQTYGQYNRTMCTTL